MTMSFLDCVRFVFVVWKAKTQKTPCVGNRNPKTLLLFQATHKARKLPVATEDTLTPSY